MSDYISREAAVRALCDGCVDDGYCGENAFDGRYACEDVPKILAIPAADVRPVKEGRWKPRDLTYGRQYYYCTSCEETVDMPTAMGIPLFNYCPNCGADMRGDP